MQARHHPALLPGPRKQWLFFPFAFGGGLSGGQCQDGNQPSSPTCGPVLGALRAFSGKKGTQGKLAGSLEQEKPRLERTHLGMKAARPLPGCVSRGLWLPSLCVGSLSVNKNSNAIPGTEWMVAVVLLVTGRNGKDWDNMSTEAKWP